MQKQKILLISILALFLCHISRAQDSTMLTLQECVDIAIKNNLQVKQSELTMQSNGVNFKQSKDNLLPFIGASATQGTSFGRNISSSTNTYVNQQIDFGNYGINGSLILFSGLQLQNAIRQNAFAYDASKLDWQQQKDNITLNVILSYLQVLSTEDLLAIAREQADVDQKQVERAEIQNREGAIPPSTLTDLQGQYANDQVNIVNSINAFESAKINLFQFLNISYNKGARYERVPLNVPISDYAGNPDSIYQTALHTLPLIKSSDLRIRSFEQALKVARGAYFPTLSLNGSLNTNYSSAGTNNIPGPFFNDTTINYVTVNNTNYNIIEKNQSFTNTKIPFGDQFKNNRGTQISLSLQIPILNSFRARNNVKLAKINLENQRYIANNTRLQLQQSVELAYQNMVSAYGQYKSYQDQVTAYTQSYRSAEIRFNAGVITSVDYVIAKNNVDRANTNLIAARYNYIFRTKILDYYQGRLTW